MKMLFTALYLISSLSAFAADGFWIVVSREKHLGYGKPTELSEVKIWLGNEDKQFFCVNEKWMYFYINRSLTIIAPDGFTQMSKDIETDYIADEFLYFNSRTRTGLEEARIIGGENIEEEELSIIPEAHRDGVIVSGFKCT